MANTYTQIYVQVVFAVQGRQNLIRPERKEELHKYITGIVTRQGQKLLAIHCMPDHTHILIGLKPNMALSDLVHDIKTGSTNHINENRWVVGPMALLDMAGLDIYRSVSSFLNADLCNRADVATLVEDKIAAKTLGLKTGGGIYDYAPDAIPALQAERAKKLIAVRRILEARG